ncbi:MAG: heme-binding domain-containing protein [Candidatus Zixiibacteriota bacterium]
MTFSIVYGRAPMQANTPGTRRSAPHLLTSLILSTALILLFGLRPALGHDDDDHDAKPDSLAMSDTSAAAQALRSSLDSVYIAIAMTYPTVKPMLKYSCYDCHSDQTDYPWYHGLPLVKGFLDDHVEEAREHLDMSNGFPFGGHASQLKQLHEIEEQVEEGEMPLFSYRIMHWGKLIEGEKQDTLFEWIASSEAAIKQVYANHGVSPETKDDDDGDDDGDDDDDHDHDDDNDHDDDD